MDVVLLSRIQFALTIMFHYLFPPLTIGLGVLLVVFEGLYLKTGNEMWHRATRFWVGIFAATFAVGVATGIVMQFQFGTNWADYSMYVGDVFGSALAAEGIFAFFLESGFLAVLVFGWDRVGKKTHFFATIMVALGAIFSSIWITVANSWQQTPRGHHIVPVLDKDGVQVMARGEPVHRAEIVDFWAMVFNPSAVDRLVHVWVGCLVLGAFFVMSVCAFYVLKGRHVEFAKRTFVVALIAGTIASLGAAVSGHSNARMVARHQPAKLAAFEGIYETAEDGAGLHLWGIPDDDEKRVRWGVQIPGLLSLVAFDDPDAPVTGLDRFRPEDRPPTLIPFVTFHAMVLLGGIFIAACLLSWIYLWRKTLFEKRWLLWVWVFLVAGAFAANQLGWVAAEVGRQPFVVYPDMQPDASGTYVPTAENPGLRTADGISRSVSAEAVLGSIIMFSVIYALLFFVWVFVLNTKIQKGPSLDEPEDRGRGDRGFMAVARDYADRSGPSLSEAREGPRGRGQGGGSREGMDAASEKARESEGGA